MKNAKDVVKELRVALNTITSYPVDWEELTVLITVKSSVENVTLTKRMEYIPDEDGTWMEWEIEEK